MKKLATLMVVILTLGLMMTGCSQSVEREEIATLKGQVVDLQSQVADLQSQIATLKGQVENSSANSFPITINYDLSRAEMIAAGNYSWVNDDITSDHFPMKGKGQVALNLELVHFDKAMYSEDVLEELDKKGLRPATLAELLAFGAKYPEKQREFPIIALGFDWRVSRGDRYVACLGRDGSSKRGLYLYYFDSGWYSDSRFLAFRK